MTRKSTLGPSLPSDWEVQLDLILQLNNDRLVEKLQQSFGRRSVADRLLTSVTTDSTMDPYLRNSTGTVLGPVGAASTSHRDTTTTNAVEINDAVEVIEEEKDEDFAEQRTSSKERFCQSAIESAERDQDLHIHNAMNNKQQQVEMFMSIFHMLQHNRGRRETGNITFMEFEQLFDSQQVRAFFQALDVEAKDAWTLFKLMDVSGARKPPWMVV
eukprot:Skav230363  [mRNA]  locus=scaffold291:61342:69362:- [translate_table: standard]